MMQHTAFFGDGEKTFSLTGPMIEELERKTGHGVGVLFRRLQAHDFSLQEITETIRLGLIGGGTSPKEAAALVQTYVNGRPLIEGFELAFAILGVRFFGNGTTANAPQDETGHAAATGDLAAAINTTDPSATLKVHVEPGGRTVAEFA